MKKCFVDLETTGLNPWKDNDNDKEKGVILSAGFVLETGEELQVIITPTPEEWSHANPIALEVNGMEWDYLVEHGVEFPEAVSEICNWLVEHNVFKEDWVFVAQNAPFDRKFLTHFMHEWLAFSGSPEEWIDFIPLYKRFGPSLGLNVKKRNQKHIALQLGVPPEPDVHEALEGARSLKRNYDALKKMVEKDGQKWPV